MNLAHQLYIVNASKVSASRDQFCYDNRILNRIENAFMESDLK